MSLDSTALREALARHGALVRVSVIGVEGSAPREVGATMLVGHDWQGGTIGGGALEFHATERARAFLASGESLTTERHALGPDLGQCCGGAVRLLYQRWEPTDAGTLGTEHSVELEGEVWTEPVDPPRVPVWIWGAGHVGTALAAILTPLPTLHVTLIDTTAADPLAAVTTVPPGAHHFVLTHSHALDFALCDALLHRGIASLGLIGSATKWAGFRARLAKCDHLPSTISRIRCPIGDKTLGKHPQAIAIGAAHGLLVALTRKGV